MMFYIIVILVLIGSLVLCVLKNKYYHKYLLENNIIEII